MLNLLLILILNNSLVAQPEQMFVVTDSPFDTHGTIILSSRDGWRFQPGDDISGNPEKILHHGMRAIDKSFSAEFKTNFDPDLPKVEVVPHEMGRVLLNLINNAFYSVDQRGKILSGQKRDYKPAVVVTTKKNAGRIEISVKDNGPGIPEEIRTKIFQPFFTTRPTGQGTGLGLSLSYDIVKFHGGELLINASGNEGSLSGLAGKNEDNLRGAEFVIILKSG